MFCVVSFGAILLMGSEIRCSPVEVGSFNHYLQGLGYIPNGGDCRISEPSTHITRHGAPLNPRWSPPVNDSKTTLFLDALVQTSALKHCNQPSVAGDQLSRFFCWQMWIMRILVEMTVLGGSRGCFLYVSS